MRGKLVAAVGLGLYVIPASSTAQVNFPVPNLVPGLQKYFSGTNCRAGVSAVGSYDPSLGRSVKLKKLELLINGILVKTVTPPLPTKKPLVAAVMFDSTASMFQGSGSTAAIAARATDELNRVFQQSSAGVPIKNRAVMLRQPIGGPDPTSLFASSLAGMGYQVSMLNSSTWGYEAGLDEVEGASIHYVQGHGGTLFHECATSNETIDAYRLPYGQITGSRATFYSEERRISVGNPAASGWPPYNLSGNPPINLAFLDFCQSGAADPGGLHSPNSAFVELLWPYYNYWSQSSGIVENQALVSWSWFMLVSETCNRFEAVMGHLELGYTAVEMRNHVDENSESLGIRYSLGSGLFDETFYLDDELQMPVYGDWYARVSGVYTGSTSGLGVKFI